MFKNIEDIIKNEYEELSKSHKKIADFVMANIRLIPLLSINEIAKETSTSTSTITRFANALDYSGYQDLQTTLKKRLSEEIVSFNELKTFSDKIDGDHDSLLSKIVTSNKNALDRLLNTKIENQIKRVKDILIKSKNIYIMGCRSSLSAAYYFYFIMKGITPKVKLITNVNCSLTIDLQYVTSSDSLVVISYPRYTKTSYEIVKYFESKESNIISITDSIVSPFSRYSDETIIANNGDDVYSFVVTMSVLNAIIMTYSLEETKNDLFSEQDKLCDLFDVYL